VNVVPERTSVIIEVSTEVEIVGTIVSDVSIWSEVMVSVAVWSSVVVAAAVWIAREDNISVESSTLVKV
jgi:uncharacterized protein (DUF983 family)